MEHGPLDLYIHSHYTIVWDRNKSAQLLERHGLSFEELIQEPILAFIDHPSRRNQKLLLIEYADYVWTAPCVANGDELFLKTLYPSRKHTKLWRRGEFG